MLRNFCGTLIVLCATVGTVSAQVTPMAVDASFPARPKPTNDYKLVTEVMTGVVQSHAQIKLVEMETDLHVTGEDPSFWGTNSVEVMLHVRFIYSVQLDKAQVSVTDDHIVVRLPKYMHKDIVWDAPASKVKNRHTGFLRSDRSFDDLIKSVTGERSGDTALAKADELEATLRTDAAIKLRDILARFYAPVISKPTTLAVEFDDVAVRSVRELVPARKAPGSVTPPATDKVMVVVK